MTHATRDPSPFRWLCRRGAAVLDGSVVELGRLYTDDPPVSTVTRADVVEGRVARRHLGFVRLEGLFAASQRSRRLPI